MDLKQIPKIKHTERGNFFLLAGPCAIEGEEMAMRIAERLVAVTDKLEIPLVFKGSYKKANRSRIDSFTGIGDEKALKILSKVSEAFDIPTVTDIHTNEDAALAAAYVDVLQIPAFLSPGAMQHAVQKVKDSGNDKAWITDRGTMFGYQDMVVDFRGIPEMQAFAPTVLDVTHSLQQPNQSSGVTGGRPDMIETIARAGIAVGVDGLFLETHFDPANAKSDGANMLDLQHLEKLLTNLVAIRKTINKLH
jgi:2-dehydro-3-deoxyphosphooctonate aldolase (KDO 8-P synthase)